MAETTRPRSLSWILLLSVLGCGPASPTVFTTPPPTIQVSKETTYITEPLKDDGSVDYAEALNRLASDGVTVENNAAVLLAQTLGPDLYDKPLRKQFFAKLGIPVPPQQGRYFLNTSKFVEQLVGEDGSAYIEDLEKERDNGTQRPWSREELPKLAAWLDFNEEPMKAILEATRRPSYFFPLIDVGLLFNSLLSLPHEARSIARALTARAMLAVQEGRIEDAQSDLLACHRLARLIAKGETMIEGLSGMAIESFACQAGDEMLQSGQMTDPQLLKYQQALAKLPSLRSSAEQINIFERFSSLDIVSWIAKEGDKSSKALSDLAGPESLASHPGIEKALNHLDWNLVLKTINEEYDRQYSAVSKTRYAERRTAMDDYEKHLEQVSFGLSISAQLLELSAVGKVDRKQASKVIADFLVSLLIPLTQQAQFSQDRGTTHMRLLRIAVALERFRKENDHFPDTLNELKPAGGQKLFTDLYTEKPFLYSRTNAGYLLYSTGANQKDDGGQTFDSKPPGDDIIVRMTIKQ